jgi:hypothetical protein
MTSPSPDGSLWSVSMPMMTSRLPLRLWFCR